MSAVRERLAFVKLEGSTHAGLWLDRFLPKHEGQSSGDHFDQLVQVMKVPEGYREAFDRRLEALESLQLPSVGDDSDPLPVETRVLRGRVDGRMVVGIGAASVHETSISLLRSWGLPFIPGSALKGICAVRAHLSRDPRWARAGEPGLPAGDLHRLVFGDVTSAGCVHFHDAWWIPAQGGRVPMELDAMTVHHMDYYAGKGAPMDWDEPNPVSFLTATGEYAIALSGPSRVLDVAQGLLEDALREDGVGAKTAAGYGRLTLVGPPLETPRSRERRAERERLAALVADYRGASNARPIADRLAEAHSGPLRAAAEQLAEQLFARDPKYWRRFLDEAEDRHRQVFARALERPRPPPPTRAPSAPSPQDLKRGQAWLSVKKGKEEIVVLVGDQRYKRQSRRIRHDAVRDLLEGASEKSPAPVRVRFGATEPEELFTIDIDGAGGPTT